LHNANQFGENNYLFIFPKLLRGGGRKKKRKTLSLVFFFFQFSHVAPKVAISPQEDLAKSGYIRQIEKQKI
jgi:hypothetical protein